MTPFEEYIRSLKPREGPYVPLPLYLQDGDIIQHWKNERPCYAEWIDPHLAIYRDQETDEIIGAEIGGIRRALNRANCAVVREP